MKNFSNKNIILNTIALFLAVIVIVMLVISNITSKKILEENKYIADKFNENHKSVDLSTKATDKTEKYDETASKSSNEQSNEEIAIVDYPSNYVCIGNELTAVNKEKNYAYSMKMSDMLSDMGIENNVVNLGYIGEDSRMIMARTGGFKMLVSNLVDIPSKPQRCYVNFLGEDNNWIIPLHNMEEEYMEVYIGGIEGKLYIEKVENGNNPYYIYYFIRNEEGEAAVADIGSEIVPVETTKYADYLPIIWLIDGYSNKNANTYINNINILKNIYINDDFIVLSPLESSDKDINSVDEKMVSEFGEHFINIREKMLDSNISEKYGFTLSEKDMNSIGNGKIPSCYYENFELTEQGSEFVARVILDSFN